MGLRSLLVVCTRNRPPHQASGQLGTVARFESLIRTVPFRQRRKGALQNGHEKNNEGREPKGYPTLVVCFRMNV